MARASEKGASRRSDGRAAQVRGQGGSEAVPPPVQPQRFEGWPREALYERARQLGIEGRAKLTKGQLIAALRRS